jgi:hypothetical protein
VQGPSETLLTVILPCPPNRANASGHWRTIEKAKKAYFDECAKWICTQIRTFDRSRWPFQNVRWKAHFEVKQAYDPDNLVALCKWPLDALVRFRIIENDDQKHARPESWPTQEIVRGRGKQRSMMITLLGGERE